MSERFEIAATPIDGLKILHRKPIGDHRGYLERLYCIEELGPLLTDSKNIAQINRTLTQRTGTVRGMHFQHPPHSETKFVSCLRGEVFDVAVDLRGGSKTFLRWHAEILSGANHKTLVIPEGFAHGFQTLTDDCEMLYFHTSVYRQSAEGGLHAQDPVLDIRWPVSITELSSRDCLHPPLDRAFTGLRL